MRKEIKNKRCAFDQDRAVTTDLVKAIDEDEKRFEKKCPLNFEFVTDEDSNSKKWVRRRLLNFDKIINVHVF